MDVTKVKYISLSLSAAVRRPFSKQMRMPFHGRSHPLFFTCGRRLRFLANKTIVRTVWLMRKNRKCTVTVIFN